jgi:outer membrane protein, multidrug efflux system
MTTATCFSFMTIWEQLGGGIARCLTVWAIAEAERKMAAANAPIGVAKAAFFPGLTLTGDAGYTSFNAGNLLNWESQLFQIGPTMTLPVLNGGRLKAGLQEARANYQATCAGYQQQVLIAFKDVSDSLVELKSYGEQVASETEAVTAADRAAVLSQARYKRGLINYLDVLDSERTQLQTQFQIIQLRALQLVSTVDLVKTLGGGFESDAVVRVKSDPNNTRIKLASFRKQKQNKSEINLSHLKQYGL